MYRKMSNIKNKYNCNNKSILSYLCLFILFICTSAKSQNNMFLEQIEGRTIERENYNDKGDLLNKQLFEAGKITKKKDYYEIKVTTTLYDKNKTLKEKYTTTYKCEPEKFSIVLFVFPFADPKSKETEISTKSINFKELYNIEKLENVDLDISFDSGLMNFFGSKSTIKIYDRKKEINNRSLSIKSKISIKAYAFGIRIKQLNYLLTENLNSNGLLTYQKFIENDGSYFTMLYK